MLLILVPRALTPSREEQSARAREEAENTSQKSDRYLAARTSLRARLYKAQTTTLRNSARPPKRKATWRACNQVLFFGCV